MTWEDVTQRLDAVCDAVEGLQRNLDALGFHLLFPHFGKITELEGIVARIEELDKLVYIQVYGAIIPVYGLIFQGNHCDRVKVCGLLIGKGVLVFEEGMSTIEMIE